MVKYQLQKNIEEYDEKEKNKIEEGCTFGGPDVEPEAIGDYTTEEAAKKALERYRSYVCKYTYGKNSWYVVEEYAIVVLQYDEDEGWLNTGDICEITAMPKPEEWYER